MSTILNYTPGQVATFYQEVKDGYDQRTDDGYIPVVTRVILPNFTMAAGFPQNMTRFDVGLYYFQYQIPIGAASVGTHFVDIIYMNPDTTLLVNSSRQIVVTAPFGNFGVTPGGPHYPYPRPFPHHEQPFPHHEPYPPFPHPEPFPHEHHDEHGFPFLPPHLYPRFGGR